MMTLIARQDGDEWDMNDQPDAGITIESDDEERLTQRPTDGPNGK